MTEIASKLQKAITEGHLAAAQHHADGATDRHKDTIHNLFEDWEREIAQLWSEKGLPDFNGEVFSPEVRKAFGAITNPTHQGDFVFSLMALLGVALSGTFAAAAGINQQLTERGLHQSADIKPDVGVTASWLARGWVGQGQADEWALDVGVRDLVWTNWQRYSRQYLPIDDAIELWRRHPELEALADEQLRNNGMDADTMALLKGLRWAPPSARFAAQAVTQNQIDMPTFESLLGRNGIDPDWAKVIYETEGATMPPMMANRLFREHRIDQKEYEQILLESDLKNKYVPLMALLRYRVPPMRQIVAAFHNGSLPREEAALRLDKLGFDVVDQNWMLDSAAKSTGSAGKHLSMQQHLAAYEAQLESREAATAALVTIGWSPADVELEFDVADHRATLARTSRAANAIGTRYVSWKIDRHSASVALDALGLPSAARDEALQAWDIEREERRPRLSMADLKFGYKHGTIGVDGIKPRLVAMGFDDIEVGFLMATYFPAK